MNDSLDLSPLAQVAVNLQSAKDADLIADYQVEETPSGLEARVVCRAQLEQISMTISVGEGKEVLSGKEKED